MPEKVMTYQDPQEVKLKELFEGELKPEPGKEIPGFETPKEEPKETPKETPKAEEPKETPKQEPKAEEPKEQPKEEPKETPSEWKFDPEGFNKEFETEYDSPDTLKEDLKSLTELKEKYTQLESEKDGLSQKYDEAMKSLDPMQYFVNEDEYKRQLILKKFGEEVNPAALNRIVSADLSTLSDIDVLVLGELVRNSNVYGGEAGARELVYDNLGIDLEDNPSEWTTLQKNKIASAAVSIRSNLNKLKDVEIPAKVDFEATSQAKATEAKQKLDQLTGKWDKAADKMLGGFKEMTIQDEVDGKKTDVFSYAVPDAFISGAKTDVVEFMAENGMEPTQENIEKAMEYVQERFVRENFQNMLLSYGKEIEAKVTEKKDKEVDNPEPPKDTTKPVEEADKEQAEFYEKVKSGESAPKMGGPLFGKK